MRICTINRTVAAKIPNTKIQLRCCQEINANTLLILESFKNYTEK